MYLGNSGAFRDVPIGSPLKNDFGPLRPRDFLDGLERTAAFAEILSGRHRDELDPRRVIWFVDGLTSGQDAAAFEHVVQVCDTWYRPLPNLLGADFLARGRPWFNSDPPSGGCHHALPPNRNSCYYGAGYAPLGTYAAASSHSGGVHVLFCGGSVPFVSDMIDPSLWRALGTRAGGETSPNI